MSLVAPLVAFLTAIACVPLSIQFARRLDLLDKPEARKVHQHPTPRLGGIAIVMGVIVATLTMVLLLRFVDYPISKQNYQQMLAIVGAGFFVFLVGLVDDIRSVSSAFKLVTLIASAAMICGAGSLVGELWFGGHMLLNFGWINWAITMLWIVGIAVSISFIDGLDGLAAGLALLSTVVLSTSLVAGGYIVPAIIPLALAGSLLGFLVFNWHPAKTFMGDCGSMSIGFFLASSMAVANPLVGTMRGIVLPSLALSIPIADAGLTVFRRRYEQRRSVFSAERGHIHHRLLDRGLSHFQAVITILAVSILAVGIGLVSLALEGWSTLGGLALLLPLLWGTFRLAGSVRTDEMVKALRSKREIDRVSRSNRMTFESLQLEFYHVASLSQWWQGVCRAAEQLDFTKVDLRLGEKSGRTERLAWETHNASLLECDRLHATLPIAKRKSTHEAVPMHVTLAASDSLELAGERLALFSRLMTEYSLDHLRRKQMQQRPNSNSGVGQNGTAHVDQESARGSGPFAHLRVAVVHDFLYTYCGAEKVVEQLINLFPHCDVYALFDFMPEEDRGFLRDKSVTTTFLQRMPLARTHHRAYLPLMPFAIEQLDVSRYDLVISSSYLAAKGVLTGPDQLHICYCHSPVRYAWDLQHQYLDLAGLGYGPRGLIARAILHYIRNWDVRSALGVDHFIANSQFIARRIEKVYRSKAKVVHPPVETERFVLSRDEREDFYLVAGRMVPYKRTALIAEAFSRMPDRRLVIIGEGPDSDNVRKVAGPNVEFLGHQPIDQLVQYLQRAKALVFAAEEDFGIVPVEALSCGTPVIAYNKGGVTETVVDGEHGVFFDEQTPESLIEAVGRFEAQNDFGTFDPLVLHERSTHFSQERFVSEFAAHVKKWTEQRWPSEKDEKLAVVASHLPVAGQPTTYDL